MKVKIIYIYELILTLFILTLKFIIIDKVNNYVDIITMIFWILSTFVLYKIIGLKKNNKMVVKDAIAYSIIGTMLFFLISYISGLFIGFLKNSYSLNPISIIKNTGYLIVMIVSQEIIRYIVASNITKTKKISLIILTILYIILDFVLIYNKNEVSTKMNTFIFITTMVLPLITKHILFSYIALHFDYKANLIVRLTTTLYVYLLPIVPDFSYYLTSIIGIFFPYLLYIIFNNLVKNDEKVRVINKNMWYIKVPIIAFLLVVVVLISGMVKYQIMAIGSGSMEPVYARGDAVIFERINYEYEIEIGDIIVFKHNKTHITHRVIDKLFEDGEVVYKTKGDNNKVEDDFTVNRKDVIGIVRAHIKYIGYPSVIFQEFVD